MATRELDPDDDIPTGAAFRQWGEQKGLSRTRESAVDASRLRPAGLAPREATATWLSRLRASEGDKPDPLDGGQAAAEGGGDDAGDAIAISRARRSEPRREADEVRAIEWAGDGRVDAAGEADPEDAAADGDPDRDGIPSTDTIRAVSDSARRLAMDGGSLRVDVDDARDHNTGRAGARAGVRSGASATSTPPSSTESVIRPGPWPAGRDATVALPPLPPDPPMAMPRDIEWPWWAAAGASLFWLAFFSLYFQQSVGWGNLFMLLPHEFGGFAAGAFFPVSLFLAVAAVLTRDGRYGREALILRDQLRKLSYPTDTARSQMNDVARSLTEQARMLTDASRQALAEARQVRDGLSTEVVALNALGEKFREDVAQVIRDAESQVYGLEEATERAVSRGRDAGLTLEKQSSSLGDAAEKMLAQTRVLDENLRKHVQELTLAGQQAREQGNSLTSVNEAIGRALRDGRTMGEELTSLARSLDEHLHTQQDAMEGLRGRWEKTSRQVLDDMGHQSKSVDQLVERMMSRAKVIEETIGRQSDALMGASDQSMSRLKEMEGLFTRRIQAMNTCVDEATGKLSDASLEVAQRGQEAAVATSGATDTLERAAGTLEETLRGLSTAVQRAEQRARDAAGAVKEQVESLESNTTEANRQAGFIRESIAAQTQELNDGASLIGTQLELVQSSLGQQARHLGDAANTAAARIQDTVESLRARLGELSGVSRQVNADLESVGAGLVQHAETLEEAGRRSLDYTRAASEAVQGETDTLHGVVSKVHEALEGLEQTLSARCAAITRATETADQQFSGVSRLLDSKVKDLGDTSERATGHLHSVAGALEEHMAMVDAVTGRSAGRIREMGDALEQQARVFEEVTGRGLSQATVAGNRLRQSTDGIQAAADKASDTVRGAATILGGVLEEAHERAHALVPVVEGAVATIRQEINALGLSGEKITDSAQKAAAEFARQAQGLTSAADTAEARAKALKLEMEQAEVGTFLHQASFMIERLESAAVDIARIFNPVRDEELWRRYQKGDHGVFLRHLARVMTVKQHGAVRETFETDREFRGYVTSFITDYESLLDQVQQTARADILTALFVGSDLGKVYLVLAKALGRLDTA